MVGIYESSMSRREHLQEDITMTVEKEMQSGGMVEWVESKEYILCSESVLDSTAVGIESVECEIPVSAYLQKQIKTVVFSNTDELSVLGGNNNNNNFFFENNYSYRYQDVVLRYNEDAESVNILVPNESAILLEMKIDEDLQQNKDVHVLITTLQTLNGKLKQISKRRKTKKRKVSATTEPSSSSSSVTKLPIDHRNLKFEPTLFVSNNTDITHQKWFLKIDISFYYKQNDFNSYNVMTIDYIRNTMVKYPIGEVDSNDTGNINLRQLFESMAIENTGEVIDKNGNFKLSKTQLDTLGSLHLLPFQNTTVGWMINKETRGMMADGETPVLNYLNQYVAFGYIDFFHLGYYNIYTEYLLSYDVAESYYHQETTISTETTIGARGLLCEEMGLGKTIELLSLVLLNPRETSAKKVESGGKPEKIGELYRGKTTLIVTPDSILNQWVEEMNLHSPQELKIYHYQGFKTLKKDFPDVTPILIAENLSQYDIVITSYRVISSEIHYTEFSKQQQQKDNNRSMRFDYSSPLAYIQFWRIVLDEVQSLGRSINNNIIKCCANLERVHTWGSSGTPIVSNDFDKSVLDLLTVLAYMKIPPFDSPNTFKKIHTLISTGALNIEKLIQDTLMQFDIPIRHSKNQVIDQINIPKQTKLLIPLNFHHFEQDRYDTNFREFLNQTGFDRNGTRIMEDHEQDASLMTSKLQSLIASCMTYKYAHERAMITNPSNKNDEDAMKKHFQEQKTSMKDILDEMKAGICHEIDNSLKTQIGKYISKGRFELESLEAVDCGMETLQHCLALIRQEQQEIDERDSSTQESYNTLLNLLHQACFFLATGYYMKGSERLEKDKTLVKNKQEMTKIVEFQEKEDNFYTEAEIIRRKMLKNRITNVEENILRLCNIDVNPERDFLSLVAIDKSDNFGGDFLMNNLFEELAGIFQTLNQQVKSVREYMEDCKKLLIKPIIAGDNLPDEEKAKEYESSVDAQDLIFVKLDCIEKMLVNRFKVLDEKTTDPVKNIGMNDKGELSKQHQEHLKTLPLVHGTSLKVILNKLENIRIVKSYQMVNDFVNHISQYSKMAPDMIKEIALVKEYLKSLNHVYNAKTAYYSSLQRISDSLVPLNQMETASFNKIKKDYLNFENIRELKSNQINNFRSRLKYLGTLEKLDKGENMSCLICLDTIKLGSIIRCGHFFCKECIVEWFKQKPKDMLKCPLCSIKVESVYELYDFNFSTADDANAGTDGRDSHAGAGDDNNEQSERNEKGSNTAMINNMFGNYERCLDLANIMKLNIEVDLGVKNNTLLRILKFIELKFGESAQTVVYTANIDHMYYWKFILEFSGIPTLCPISSSQKNFSETISKFKHDTKYKVLILHSRRQVAGLTLINASHIILMDPIINNSDELQAVNRINRIGQKKETYVWTVMVRGTVEETILRYKASLEDECEICSSSTPKKRINRFLVDTISSIDENHIWNCFFYGADKET